MESLRLRHREKKAESACTGKSSKPEKTLNPRYASILSGKPNGWQRAAIDCCSLCPKLSEGKLDGCRLRVGLWIRAPFGLAAAGRIPAPALLAFRVPGPEWCRDTRCVESCVRRHGCRVAHPCPLAFHRIALPRVVRVSRISLRVIAGFSEKPNLALRITPDRGEV